MKEKKQSDLSVLLGYAGSYKKLTFLGLGLSAIAMILGMAPYLCIWLAARDLIAVGIVKASMSISIGTFRITGSILSAYPTGISPTAAASEPSVSVHQWAE